MQMRGYKRGDRHWINIFYVFEVLMFVVGIVLICQGYNLEYNMFSYISVGFIMFGMLMAFMQKRDSY